MNYKRHLGIAMALVVITTVVAYFLLRIGYQLPTQASQEATQIDTLERLHGLDGGGAVRRKLRVGQGKMVKRVLPEDFTCAVDEAGSG